MCIVMAPAGGEAILASICSNHKLPRPAAAGTVLRPSEQVRGQGGSGRRRRARREFLQPSGELVEPRECAGAV